MQRRMVVLPHPLEPSSTDIAPARKETVKSEITSTVPKDLTRRSIVTLAAEPSEPCVDKGSELGTATFGMGMGAIRSRYDSRGTLENASGRCKERFSRAGEVLQLRPYLGRSKDVEPVQPVA